MTTTIYPTLISKIRTVLEAVTKIKVVYDYPITKITQYPACIFLPSSFENNKETNQENFKTYTFKLYVVIGTKQTTMDNAWSVVMPKTLDAVLQALDEGWDFDTIAGHRVWTNVETGLWSVSEEQDGLQITAEIDLTAKLLTAS